MAGQTVQDERVLVIEVPTVYESAMQGVKVEVDAFDFLRFASVGFVLGTGDVTPCLLTQYGVGRLAARLAEDGPVDFLVPVEDCSSSPGRLRVVGVTDEVVVTLDIRDDELGRAAAAHAVLDRAELAAAMSRTGKFMDEQFGS